MGAGRAAGGGSVARPTPLPAADRITPADRLVRRLNRWRARLWCLTGRHWWGYHHNPEVGGPRAVYQLCRRCGRERMRHMRPSEYFAP